MSTTETCTISKNQGKNSQSNDREEEIYFIILSQSEEKVSLNDLKFISEITPQKIYKKKLK